VLLQTASQTAESESKGCDEIEERRRADLLCLGLRSFLRLRTRVGVLELIDDEHALKVRGSQAWLRDTSLSKGGKGSCT
jgi:hypothetical protein